MKKVNKIAAVIMAAFVFASAVNVSADVSFSDIKRHILLDSKTDSAEYDTNKNGRTDVFDVCRMKQQILYNNDESDVSDAVEFFSFGDAEIDYSEGKIYIPLCFDTNEYDLSSFSLTIGWDASVFKFTNTLSADMYGSWNRNTYNSRGTSDIVFDVDGYETDPGAAFTAVFEMKNGVQNGTYSFTITNVSVSVYDDSGDVYVLSAEECAENCGTYTYVIDSTTAPPAVTEPPSDNPVITLPDVPLDTPPSDTSDTLNTSDIYNAMIALKSSYPEGMGWTNNNSYRWKGGIYSIGYGCAGFAFMLSDAAFGSAPARMITDLSGYQIRVGDILRVNNDSHSVIVLEVNSKGVVIAEGNYNNSIHWGRTMTWSDLDRTLDYVLTRYAD